MMSKLRALSTHLCVAEIKYCIKPKKKKSSKCQETSRPTFVSMHKLTLESTILNYLRLVKDRHILTPK